MREPPPEWDPPGWAPERLQTRDAESLLAYQAALADATARLNRLADKVRRALTAFQVKCPDENCQLGAVYRLPLREGGHRELVRARTSGDRGRRPQDGLLGWNWKDYGMMPAWWPVGCSHGQGKLTQEWLAECVQAVDKVLTPDSSQKEISKGLRSRVFRIPQRHWATRGSGAEAGSP